MSESADAAEQLIDSELWSTEMITIALERTFQETLKECGAPDSDNNYGFIEALFEELDRITDTVLESIGDREPEDEDAIDLSKLTPLQYYFTCTRVWSELAEHICLIIIDVMEQHKIVAPDAFHKFVRKMVDARLIELRERFDEEEGDHPRQDYEDYFNIIRRICSLAESVFIMAEPVITAPKRKKAGEPTKVAKKKAKKSEGDENSSSSGDDSDEDSDE